MNIYGYCRISTAKQSIDRQIRNIKAEYPTAHIVQEAYTGTSIFRPEWLKLYRVLKAGDLMSWLINMHLPFSVLFSISLV